MDAVALMGEQILLVAQATADRGGLGCAKLVVFANIPQDVPFMAGAYLGVGEPDVVINVGVSGPGVVKKAIDRALEDGVRIKDAIAQVVAEHPLPDGSLPNRKQVYTAVLAMIS